MSDREADRSLQRPVGGRANAVDRYLLWDELSPTERSDFAAAMGYEPPPLTPEERAEWLQSFEEVVMSSDAFIPFRDNVDRAAMTGVTHIAHAGGSIRDDSVREAAEELGITVIETGVRCFLH